MFLRLILMIAYVHVFLVLCHPSHPISKLQITSTLLGRFQLRLDLLQAWLIFPFVSNMQNAYKGWWLLTFMSHQYYIATSIIFPTPQNSGENSLSGSIPTEIGYLTSLATLNFCKWHAKRIQRMMIANFHVPPIPYCHLYHISYITKNRWNQPYWNDSNWDRISHRLDCSSIW